MDFLEKMRARTSPNVLDLLIKQLPAFMNEEHSEGFRNVAGTVVPTTIEDVGLSLALGPAKVIPKLARLGGLGLAGTGYAPDAEAASGGLSKLAGLVSPELGTIYRDSVAFGKSFPGASDDGPGDAARHAYASSRVARQFSPTTAKFLGWLNEATSLGADRRAVRMDDFNNAAGLGLSDLEDEAVKQRIEEMIRLNQLKYMNRRSNPNAGYASGGIIRKAAPQAGKWFDELVDFIKNRRTHDEGQIERAERVLRDMPHTRDIYSPEALGEKIVFAGPDTVLGMPPSQFLSLAHPLPEDIGRPYIESYKKLLTARQFEPNPDLFTQRYNERMMGKEFKGFDDIPYLKFKSGVPTRIIGHEGRHRNKVIEEMFGSDTPSPVFMMGDAPLGRGSRVFPETEDLNMLQYMVPSDLSKLNRYAGGGLVQANEMHTGKRGPCGCSCDTCAKRGMCERAK